MRRLSLLVLVACGHSRPPMETSTDMRPPIAATHPHQVTSPNGSREDPYYWLRDDTRSDPAVLDYLRAENAYAQHVLAPVAKLEQELVDELRSHVDAEEPSVPVFDAGYYLYTRHERDREQPIYARRKGRLDAPEEIVLDGNELARGHEFYKIGAQALSRDGRYVAWVDDVVGRRQYRLHVKDLTTGVVLPDTATNVSDSIVWANDNRTVFYIGKDDVTLREDRVVAHRLGDHDDREVFREPDASYFVSVQPTKSRRYVQIVLEAITNREVRLIDADEPESSPRVFLPREHGHIYELDHVDGRFVVRTNDRSTNFKIVTVPDGQERDRTRWQDVVAARDDQLVESFAAYRRFVAVAVRVGGFRRVLVVVPGKEPYYVATPDVVSTAAPVDTPDALTTKLRYDYSSLVTPDAIYELDVDTGQATLLHQKRVPRYDPTQYASALAHARAPDGAQVPISVVFRKDTKLDGTAPIIVYGYGSHGISYNPAFDLRRIPLLDRGWVIAIAHVRGGQELGRSWYDGGTLMHKRNTFTDFIAATEALVAQHYGARDQVFASGTSAGGLVMGAIANMRPDLYRGIVAKVPFVDIVTTMLDESIPLTTNEFDVWGNPKEKTAYDYMLSYSPYDNVSARAYPAMYVKTSLWDSQVQYYEPAKWVAKLRAMKTDANPLVLDVDMEAGHGGKSGRLDRLRDSARGDAFVIYVRGLPDARTRR